MYFSLSEQPLQPGVLAEFDRAFQNLGPGPCQAADAECVCPLLLCNVLVNSGIGADCRGLSQGVEGAGEPCSLDRSSMTVMLREVRANRDKIISSSPCSTQPG